MIVNFLKHHKKANFLGIHGESLGGCIGIQLAEAFGCDFFFADRTFAYISDAVLFRFGKFAYFFYKIACFTDTDLVSKYLNIDCYKIISADPFDNIILDLASLKSGVAARIITNSSNSIGKTFLGNKWKDLNNIITSQESQKFCKSLTELIKIWNSSGGSIQEAKTQTVFTTETNEESNIKELIKRIVYVFNNIDAGGMPLRSVVNENYTEIQFQVWLMVLETWGSFKDIVFNHSNSMALKSVSDLRIAIFQLKKFENTRIWETLSSIYCTLEKILENLQEKIHRPLMETIKSEDNANCVDFSSAGNLISINCGHSGQFNHMEKSLYENHLLNAGFLF